MNPVSKMAEIGALVGDPARANMLLALMSGAALSAGELARAAGVAAPTASGHLARLLAGGMLSVERQGKHRYYRLSGSEVAELIEQLLVVSTEQAQRQIVHHHWRGPAELRDARTCYDHLAGRLGVALAEGLVGRGLLRLEPDSFALTMAGERALDEFGIDLVALRQQKRSFARKCLDWSERRPHLGGALGAALLQRSIENGWLRRQSGSRVIAITPKGRQEMSERLGLAPSFQDFARRRAG